MPCLAQSYGVQNESPRLATRYLSEATETIFVALWDGRGYLRPSRAKERKRKAKRAAALVLFLKTPGTSLGGRSRRYRGLCSRGSGVAPTEPSGFSHERAAEEVRVHAEIRDHRIWRSGRV